MHRDWNPAEIRLAEELLEKVREFGADLAGLAAVADLTDGPSERLFPHMKDHARDHFANEITTGLPHGTVLWREGEETLLVFAVSHPEEKPELDWWYGEINPPGNQLLTAIAKKLRDYLAEKHPEIKADETYISAMKAVDSYGKTAGTGRLIYNDSVTKLNRELRMFPTSLLGGLFGFRQRDYLESVEEKADMPSMK